ncbi:hypothetical protein RND81_12G040800 [Saponaria officinalis]|uniref:Uncharacterized protein n=1 Tax=Saponaria officinalis TaxID=3572 RepID=A0AAW1H4T8_SAPOF
MLCLLLALVKPLLVLKLLMALSSHRKEVVFDPRR